MPPHDPKAPTANHCEFLLLGRSFEGKRFMSPGFRAVIIRLRFGRR